MTHRDDESLKVAKEAATEKDKTYYTGSKTSYDYSALFNETLPKDDVPDVSRCEVKTVEMR